MSQVTVPEVANEILETSLLANCLGGNKKAVADRTLKVLKVDARRQEGSHTKGAVDDGSLFFSYTFPDGTRGDYRLIAGTYSEETGFQAAAFLKTITPPGGEPQSVIKLVFPGTAKENQFKDANAYRTFWRMNLGTQIHDIKNWLTSDFLPRLPPDQRWDVEITSHCLGTQGALWAKAYLEEQCGNRVRVLKTALLEPTSPGLVIDGIVDQLKKIYGSDTEQEMASLYHNTYTVLVDPPTLVNPLGYGHMWDTAAAGTQHFTFHLPKTRLYEEADALVKSGVRNMVSFWWDTKTKRKAQIKARQSAPTEGQGPHFNIPSAGEVRATLEAAPGGPAPAEQPINQAAQPATATAAPAKEPKEPKKRREQHPFFDTGLGKEVKQQFFLNHYLLAMAAPVLASHELAKGEYKPSKDKPNPRPLAELITEESDPPWARRAQDMTAHRPPALPERQMDAVHTSHPYVMEAKDPPDCDMRHDLERHLRQRRVAHAASAGIIGEGGEGLEPLRPAGGGLRSTKFERLHDRLQQRVIAAGMAGYRHLNNGIGTLRGTMPVREGAETGVPPLATPPANLARDFSRAGILNQEDSDYKSIDDCGYPPGFFRSFARAYVRDLLKQLEEFAALVPDETAQARLRDAVKPIVSAERAVSPLSAHLGLPPYEDSERQHFAEHEVMQILRALPGLQAALDAAAPKKSEPRCIPGQEHAGELERAHKAVEGAMKNMESNLRRGYEIEEGQEHRSGLSR